MSSNGKSGTTTIAARVPVELKEDLDAVMAELGLTVSGGLIQLARYVIDHRSLPQAPRLEGDQLLPFAREEPPPPREFDREAFEALARILKEATLRVDLKEAMREVLPDVLSEVLRPELAAAAVLAAKLAGLDAGAALEVAREALVTGKLQKEVAP